MISNSSYSRSRSRHRRGGSGSSLLHVIATGITILIALPLSAAEGKKKDRKLTPRRAAAIAAAEKAYAETIRALDKTLGNKKDKRSKRAYAQAKAQALAKYGAVLLEHKQHQRRQELEEELIQLREQGVILVGIPRDLVFVPLAQGNPQCERKAPAELDVADLINALSFYRGQCQEKRLGVVTRMRLSDSGTFRTTVEIGTDCAFWLYFRSPREQKVKLKLAISKNDKIRAVYVNARKEKGRKSVKAEFRKGTNLLLIHTQNVKGQTLELRVEVKAEDLEVGIMAEPKKAKKRNRDKKTERE